MNSGASPGQPTVTKQYEFGTGASWEGNRIGMASHWPCFADTVVYPPTGSTAKDREMSTHAYDLLGVALFTYLPVYVCYAAFVAYCARSLLCVP